MKTSKVKEIKVLYDKIGYHKKLMLLFFVIIATVIIEMITIPYIIRQILDIYIPEHNKKGLIIFVAIYIVVLISQCYMVLMHCDMRCILKRLMQRDLRGKIFSKLQYVKAKFYDENHTGIILQFLQDDSSKAGELFPIVITEMFVMGLIRFGIILVFLFFLNIKITLVILGLYVLGLIITLIVNKKTVKKIHEIRKLNMDIYSEINEGIQNFFTIKTLEIIEQRSIRLQKKLNSFTQSNIKLEKIISMYKGIFELIISFSTIIVLYYGSLEVLQGIMTYASLMLMIDYTSSLEHQFNWFLKHLTDFNQSIIAYSKILQLLEQEEEELLEEGEELEGKIKEIEFKNVSFTYDGHKNVIKNFSFKVNENKKIALIGRTGSGKTTITNLLSRLYEVEKGEILINNNNSKKYTIKSIRDKIGYIMQDVTIVPNTIIDNLRYVNKDITIDEIENIFKQLKLHDKIISLKDGYETDIYNNMDLFSTGERQLINFARIMAINPDIIILDEVTSALSSNMEKLVQNAIEKVTKGKIAFIIAHRLNTIKICDDILVINNGKLLEEGSHDELIKQNGYYAKLCEYAKLY